MLRMEGLGQRLKQCREAAGFTQLELAKACGVTPGAISNLERGDSQMMAASHLFAAAKALRVDAEWLATGIGHKSGKSLLFHLSPDATMMADQIDRLTPEQRHILQALLQQLTK